MAKIHCKPVIMELVGQDGNAFSLMGNWKRNAKRQGRNPEEVDAVLDDCRSGDYDHLLQVLIAHTTNE